MNGPLALKQQREQLAFIMKESRANTKSTKEEQRKDQMHQLKMLKAGGGAVAMAPMAPPMMNNPEAGASDTVPAMLTPGEAVIPAPAAQHPDNKPVIEALVNEGRMANQGFSDGGVDVPPMGYAEGTVDAFSNNMVPTNNSAPPMVTGFGPTPEQVAFMATQVPTEPVVASAVPQVAAITDAEIRFKESSNNPKAQSVNSSAYGGYQMTKDSFTDAIKNNRKLEGLDKSDPANQELFKDSYRQVLRKQLEAKGVDPKSIDRSTINRAWVVGAGGYNSLLNADRNLQLNEVLPKSYFALDKNGEPINPNLVNKTVGQFLDSNDPYSRVKAGQAVNAPLAGTPVDPSTLVGIPVDPSRMVPQEMERSVAKPTGREVLIAKQDLANSTNLTTRANAQAILDRANTVGIAVDDSNAMRTAPISDSRPTINEAVPVPAGVMPPELGNEFGDVLEGETKRRQLTTTESIEALDKEIANKDPNNPLDMRTISELEAQKSQLRSEAKARGEIPEAVKDTSPQATIARTGFATKEEAAEAAINIVEERPELLDPLATDLPTMDANTGQISPPDPKEPSTWWQNLGDAFGKMFSAGEGGLFSDKEFIKFGILLAGGLLTGGSFAGSLRYAGMYSLQSADKREAAEAGLEKERIKAGGKAKGERIKTLSTEINDGIKSGRFDLQTGNRMLKTLNGPDGVMRTEGILSQDGIESAAYRAGIDPKSDVSVLVAGSMTPIKAYPNPDGKGYVRIVKETDAKGNVKSFLEKLPENTTAETKDTYDQVSRSVFNGMADKFISTSIKYDSNNKPINVVEGFGAKTINIQLKEWSNNQRRLGLNDDPTEYTEVIRVALKQAIDGGNKNPHVGNLLALAVINTESLVDPEKLKDVQSGYIGKAVDDINLSSGFKTDREKKDFMDGLKGSNSSKQKRLAKELNDRSTEFFDKVSEAYELGETRYDQDELASEYKSSAGKNIDKALYNKIKEAPNEWWGYVYYQIALKGQSQKDAKQKKE